MYSCTYKKKKEQCLLKNNKYPITKNNKINEGRIHAAISYGSKFGDLSTLKKNGLCSLVKKEGIKSNVCHTK
jgi:hypothetical protein